MFTLPRGGSRLRNKIEKNATLRRQTVDFGTIVTPHFFSCVIVARIGADYVRTGPIDFPFRSKKQQTSNSRKQTKTTGTYKAYEQVIMREEQCAKREPSLFLASYAA